ncbi:RNA polymerase sigma factor [Paraliomyxa miuraensis]|uniref:RNA polymerase sigma factor n=1 Tax=Paraliomyxa miuraensis TaxID=376150 RepID=UPI00225C368D|nr:hypothetical protein [Paraliomyxa miuraensis]MCX4247388.1 hypothetical protein [Paraliomyxa miuraensis]
MAEIESVTPTLVPVPDPLTTTHALAGDPRALHRLCAHYHPQVVGLSRRVAARHGLAEGEHELAQEVWSRLLARGRVRLRDYDPARGSFRSFLRLLAWQQAHAVAKRWARRRRCEQELARLAPVARPSAPPPSGAIESRQLLRLALDAAAPLDELDHRLLGEVLVVQRSVHELAPRLARSPSALYKRMHRLRARLVTEARRLEA